MVMTKYPGLYPMAKELSKILGKHPDSLRQVILSNVKHLIENIPPEEMISIFTKED